MVEPGNIFFALKGENFNGNEFAQKALDSGCSFALIDEDEFQNSSNFILVKNVTETLQELAKYHRNTFKIPIIGITGSNGKTTTKELMNEVLSEKYNTLATEGNLNNHIGVPLTLLKLNRQHEIAIIEMGANHLDEIATLCKIAKPELGLITNIGKAHVGEFGSFENIIKSKLELYDFIQANNGHLFVNADDELLMQNAIGNECSTYGSLSGAIKGKVESSEEFLSIYMKAPDLGIIQTQLFGNYNLHNILAAVAVGTYFNVNTEQIKNGIENYIPSNNRSQIFKTKKNTLILDAYNANPSSMMAALENFKVAKGIKKFFILGDMLELGTESMNEHEKIITWTKQHDLNGIFVGDQFMSAYPDSAFLNVEQIISGSILKDIEDHTILVKGSRGIKLEQLKEVL